MIPSLAQLHISTNEHLKRKLNFSGEEDSNNLTEGQDAYYFNFTEGQDTYDEAKAAEELSQWLSSDDEELADDNSSRTLDTPSPTAEIVQNLENDLLPRTPDSADPSASFLTPMRQPVSRVVEAPTKAKPEWLISATKHTQYKNFHSLLEDDRKQAAAFKEYRIIQLQNLLGRMCNRLLDAGHEYLRQMIYNALFMIKCNEWTM